MPSKLGSAVGGAMVAGLLFVVYALGASRTIYVGDSGELVTAVALLGIPHPSGYPLYVLLGKAWTILIPVGSVAFRMSLFSAACAAVACGLLYVLCRRLGQAAPASLLAAGLLALGPSFWTEATIQRTYSLNAMCLLAVTLAFQRWLELRETRHLAAAFLLCGLGASNHLFMVACAACVAIVAAISEPSVLRRPAAALGPAAFLAGLLPYIYLPVRSRFDPHLDWGNPETLQGLARVVLRRDYWDRAWLESPADLLAIVADYLRGVGMELAWIGAALAMLGALTLWRKGEVGRSDERSGRGAGGREIVLLSLFVMLANVATLSIHGSRADLFVWHRYYIPSYAMAALLAGAGCGELLRKLPGTLRHTPLLVPILLIGMGWMGWREHDRSRYRVADDFSRTILHSLPPGATLLASDDNILFPLMYLHFVEGVRADVRLVSQGVGAALPPIRFDPDVEPLFLTHHPNWNLAGLEVDPVGLLFQARRAGAPEGPVALRARLEGADDPSVPKDYLTQNLIGHFHYMLGVTAERHDWLKAREALRRAEAAAPGNDVLFYNLGLIYWRNGLLEDSLEAFRRSHQINPRPLTSLDHPRASTRIAEVTAERDRLARLEASLADDPVVRAAGPGTAAFHDRMAVLLDQRGEAIAARAHRLQALQHQAESVRTPSGDQEP